MDNGWTGAWYSAFRGVFGTYLFWHFAALLPWGEEMYSSAGVLAEGSLSPLLYAFPNLLALADSPVFVTAFLLSATFASVLFSLGKWDRPAAVWIWYVLACLFGRNPLTANPSLPFVGWMLLAHVFLPPAPYGSLAARGANNDGASAPWRFDRRIFLAAWIVLAVSYSYSGYTKLVSPSWVDGSALRDVLNNPLARASWLREWILGLPEVCLQVGTWLGLVLELAYLPLALLPRMRPWIWLALVGMHCNLIVLIDFADLSLGMLMMHFFTFDPGWLEGLPRSPFAAEVAEVAEAGPGADGGSVL